MVDARHGRQVVGERACLLLLESEVLLAGRVQQVERRAPQVCLSDAFDRFVWERKRAHLHDRRRALLRHAEREAVGVVCEHRVGRAHEEEEDERKNKLKVEH